MFSIKFYNIYARAIISYHFANIINFEASMEQKGRMQRLCQGGRLHGESSIDKKNGQEPSISMNKDEFDLSSESGRPRPL